MGLWVGVQGQGEEGEMIFNYKGFSFCVNTPEKRHFNISGGNSNGHNFELKLGLSSIAMC